VVERLLYVLPHPGFFTHSGSVGGHIAHVRGFTTAVVRRGIEVHAIGPEGLAAVLGPGGVKCIEVAPTRWPANLGWSLRLLRAIRAQLANTAYRACYARYAARFVGHLPALRGVLGRLPLVLEVNSIGTQRHAWMHPLDARALRVADLLVAVSTNLAEMLAARFPSIPRNRLLVLPNGVDLSRFATANVARESAQRLKIGYIGVLKDAYGIEDLIAAFAQLQRGAELSIVGDGAGRQGLEKRAAGIAGVRFEGAIPADGVPSCLRSMDILVYTNTRQNSFQSPIKLYEYMAAGRAIVAADTPQVCELFGRGRLGLTYECSNVADLTAKLQLLAADEKLRSELGNAAAAEAVHHSWDSRVGQLWSSL
jgi:glycosyltransferase involved in cell wall biosynthesis